MRIFIFLGIFLSSCTPSGSDFKWAYRTCHKDSSECLKPSALFLTKEDCQTYIERFSHRCLGAEHLRGAQIGEVVCWKNESTISRSECNEL
jgi:hypothetical protein